MFDPTAMERGVRRVAEQRIQEAMREGKFDRLAGAGEPMACADEPFDEMWWLRKWVKREKLSQPALNRELREAKSGA